MKKKVIKPFGPIRWSYKPSNVTSASTTWEDVSNSMINFKKSFGEKKIVRCKCGKVLVKEDALEGKYCNIICKYDLEKIEDDEEEDTE